MAQLNASEEHIPHRKHRRRPKAPPVAFEVSGFLHSVAAAPEQTEPEEGPVASNASEAGSGVGVAPAPDSGAISSRLAAKNFSAELPVPIKPVLS